MDRAILVWPSASLPGGGNGSWFGLDSDGRAKNVF